MPSKDWNISRAAAASVSMSRKVMGSVSRLSAKLARFAGEGQRAGGL
jgi:hypothetical protein